MGSYLRNHDVTFEPIDQWPGTPTAERQVSRFKSRLQKTLDLLDHELWELDAEDVVIQAYLDRNKIRQDGMMRADAQPVRPGVILSFASKHGNLMYPCDTFSTWTDNLRAIAMALESLRRVDRYGVTRRAEQYRGWQQLPSPSGPVIKTRTEAIRFLMKILGKNTGIEMGAMEQAIRDAQFKTHPDRGGNAEDFKRVMECERILKEQP